MNAISVRHTQLSLLSKYILKKHMYKMLLQHTEKLWIVKTENGDVTVVSDLLSYLHCHTVHYFVPI